MVGTGTLVIGASIVVVMGVALVLLVRLFRDADKP